MTIHTPFESPDRVDYKYVRNMLFSRMFSVIPDPKILKPMLRLFRKNIRKLKTRFSRLRKKIFPNFFYSINLGVEKLTQVKVIASGFSSKC